MKKSFNKNLWILVGIFLLIFLFQQIYWLPGFNLFKSKPVTIDETPIIIKEIRALAQLIAIRAYDETALDSSKPKNLPSFPGLRPDPDKIVVIAKSTIDAGIDLKEISDKDVHFSNDTLLLKLPKAKILSLIINPSGYEIFDEKGSWTDQQVTEIKLRLRSKLESRALASGLIDKANNRSALLMKNFLFALGYKKVIIISS